MTLFVIVAGLFIAVIVGVLLYVLLRADRSTAEAGVAARALNAAILREQMADLEREHASGEMGDEAYTRARQEIERRALEDVSEQAPKAAAGARRPMLAAALGLAVPALVIGLYAALGEPAAMGGGKQAASADGGHALGQQQIVAMVERLAERLQDNPSDGNGWLMLAKSYGVLGRFPESAAAYGRAITLLPPDAQLLADFADTVAMAQGKQLSGEPEKIVRQALAVDPRNLKALALSGTIAFEKKDYRSAIGEWQKILTLVPEGSQAAVGIQNSIRDAENRLAATGGAGATPVAAVDQTRVSGSVNIDPALAAKVSRGDTLYVFARTPDGPRMPVAMVRLTADNLPASFLLDDSMSMSPNYRLSQQKTVVIGARLSKSGDAQPRAGDLEGFSAAVAPGTKGVTIVIGSVVK